MKKIIVFALAASLVATAATAETLSLTVDEAVELAMTRNLGLQQSAIELRTKERAKEKAWNVFVPSMAASAGVTADHYGLFDHEYAYSSGFGDAGNLGINGGLNLSLPINIGLSAGISTLKSDYEAGLLSYQDAAKQLEKNIRQQFYNLLANRENIQLEQANLELARKRLEQARNNFANGLVPELEVLSAEVTVASGQPKLDDVKAKYESMLLKFRFDLGIDRNLGIELDGDLETELYDMDAEELISRYMAGRLDLRELDQQIETLENTKKGMNWNMNSPTLNLGYTWGIGGSNSDSMSAYYDSNLDGDSDLNYVGIDPWSDWADYGSLSIGLQWKFDGFIPGSNTNVQLKEMQDSIDTLILAKEMALEGAGMEITNSVNNLATARKTIEASTSAVELARRNYELTEEAYNVGTRELLDVETQQQAYLEATQQLLLAKYGYIAGLLDLEYALNAPMEEFLN